MKKKIIIGVSAAVIVIAAIAAGVIMGVSSKKKSSNDINVSCKAVVTNKDEKDKKTGKYIRKERYATRWALKSRITEKRLRKMVILQIVMNLVMAT